MDNRDEDTNLPHTSPFEAIRKKAEDGSEKKLRMEVSTGTLVSLPGYLAIRNMENLRMPLRKPKLPVKAVARPLQIISLM